MGGEFDDHLDAIAKFAERGLVDPERVGVMGVLGDAANPEVQRPHYRRLYALHG
jgi:hypothetical protein